jgi:uncharacterized protein
MFDSGLSPQDVLTIQALLSQQPKIEQAILYGSRAMGRYREGSDVDLTLQGSDLAIEDAMRLHSALEDSDLPYQFDVSVRSLIQNKELLDHIQRVGKVLYQADSRALECD